MINMKKKQAARKKKKVDRVIKEHEYTNSDRQAGVAEGLNKLFALTFMKVFGAHP